MNLWLDFETRSRCDLKAKGVYNYAQDASTEVLCMSYAFDDNDVVTWLPGQPFPAAVRNHTGLIYAHNAAFERLIFWYVLQINFKLEQFYCTAAQARANCAPGSLEDVGRFAGADMRKDHRGSQLIRLLSVPQANGQFREDAALMAEMVTYCEQDVRAMRAISLGLRQLSADELADYHVNERINDRGVLVDVPLCHAAVKYSAEETVEIQQIVSEVTEGVITSVRSPKMREWVLERVGPEAKKLMWTGEKYSIDKTVRANLLRWKTTMRFRPMLQTLSNAQTTSGRLRLRSSTASQTSPMKRITESEALSFLLEGLPPGERRAMVRKFTTLPASAPKSLMKYATLWCVATQSRQDLVNALQMCSRGCSGLR